MDDPCWVILTWTHTPKYQEWEETSIIKDLVLYMYAIQSEGTEEKNADQIVRKIPQLSSLTCFVTANITRIESRDYLFWKDERQVVLPQCVMVVPGLITAADEFSPKWVDVAYSMAQGTTETLHSELNGIHCARGDLVSCE